MRVILDSLGLKYSYQLPTRSGYVLDFAFRDRMKAVEVDGYYHQFRKEEDLYRDAILKRGGWRILRIDADQIETEATLTKLREFLFWV